MSMTEKYLNDKNIDTTTTTWTKEDENEMISFIMSPDSNENNIPKKIRCFQTKVGTDLTDVTIHIEHQKK